MTMRFTDTAVLDAAQTKEIEAGLVAVARAVRTGIQIYAGYEVGRDDMPEVRVYRPDGEVFADASLQSFSHAPVTLDHPLELVTPDNWADLAKGEVSTAAKRDGEWVMLPLIVKDRGAIDAIKSGKRQLSAGYTCALDWTPGTTADGQAYDARQTNIRINHLAIVDRARAGEKARIGDGAVSWGAAPVSTVPTRDHQKEALMPDLQKVVVDGLTIEVTDQGAQVIAKLQKQLADAQAAQATADADQAKAIAAKDAEIAKKDAEIDRLKAKVLDGAALYTAVAKRADLVAKARAIAPEVKLDGLPDAAIRKAVVEAKLGDAVKGKPEAYLDARFDILAEDAAAAGKLADALTGLKPTETNDAATREADAHKRMVDRMIGKAA